MTNLLKSEMTYSLQHEHPRYGHHLHGYIEPPFLYILLAFHYLIKFI